MIGIISYGLGNILAIKNVIDEMGVEIKIIQDPIEINDEINKIILPGVGSFDKAIQLLEKKKFIEAINNFVKKKENYLLGICVGMQILATKSEEGKKKGLNLIPIIRLLILFPKLSMVSTILGLTLNKIS